MPRYLRTFDEIKTGVTLQFEGHTHASIAKVLTAQYIEKLCEDGHITPWDRTRFIQISEERKTDENIKDLLEKMKAQLPEIISENATAKIVSLLRSAIVHPKRIRTLAKTNQWKEFQAAFEKEHARLEAEKAAKEAFERKHAE